MLNQEVFIQDKVIFKKGDFCIMYGCAEAEIFNCTQWTCESDSFESSSGEEVVFLKGRKSYFAVRFLRKLEVNLDLLKEHLLKTEYKPLTKEEIDSYRIKAYKPVY